MKNILILHGAGNNSSGNWFPWLKQTLEGKGYKVWAPDLPNSDHPDMDQWTQTIFSNKDWLFDSDSIIIGHSAGATLILGVLERLPGNIKIKKAILVAPFVELGTLPQYFKYKKLMLKGPFNWEKIKKSSKEFLFIHSDNDKYQCGLDQGKILQRNLGGKLIVKKGEGHFNLEVNEKYRQFPELLEYI